jgi:hypothetical protein
MAKINPRRAKQVGNVLVVKETSAGGMRKIRNPYNHELAVPIKTTGKDTVYQDSTGQRFTSRRI